MQKKHLPVICLSYLTDKTSESFDSALFKRIISIDPQKLLHYRSQYFTTKMPALGFSNEVIH